MGMEDAWVRGLRALLPQYWAAGHCSPPGCRAFVHPSCNIFVHCTLCVHVFSCLYSTVQLHGASLEPGLSRGLVKYVSSSITRLPSRQIQYIAKCCQHTKFVSNSFHCLKRRRIEPYKIFFVHGKTEG